MLEILQKLVGAERVWAEEPMKVHTTFRAGGCACREIRVEGERMILQAGALLVRAASTACREGLSGLEFASGIPGTVGGALVMNAGAYGGEMKDVASRVTVLTAEGTIREYTKEEMAFGYRRSRLTEEESIVLEAEFALRPGRTEEIRARMDELKEH